MDVFTKKKRSEIMSRIRSKNTSVEREVFKYLRAEGLRFSKHYKKVPGSPDVAIPSRRKALFIEGAFWHGWGYKTLRPRLNSFWRKKLEGNIRRDRRNLRKLKGMGWEVMRIWDHRLKKRPDFWLRKATNFLR